MFHVQFKTNKQTYALTILVKHITLFYILFFILFKSEQASATTSQPTLRLHLCVKAHTFHIQYPTLLWQNQIYCQSPQSTINIKQKQNTRCVDSPSSHTSLHISTLTSIFAATITKPTTDSDSQFNKKKQLLYTRGNARYIN